MKLARANDSSMKSFVSIVLIALLAVTGVMCELSARDTVVEEDQSKFDVIMALAVGDTYYGYFYDKDSVSIKVHDANTHDIISNETFKGNGKAVEYLLQSPNIKPDDLSLDGVVGETVDKAVCPPPTKRAADLFQPDASRCYQFCARSYSCTADARCPHCRYVGGLCLHQLWCV
jgi:hypothetical protein